MAPYWLNRLIVWSNAEPILTIKRILWVVPLGAILCAVYLACAAAMLMSIVFAPFALAALRCAWLALDGGITLEPYSPEAASLSLEAPIWGNPAHPFTIVANTVWLVFFGWGLALMHLAAAGVQALTIIGIPTALTNVQLALLALWPFGRSLRQRQLPTTLEELFHLRAAGDDSSPSPRQQLESWA